MFGSVRFFSYLCSVGIGGTIEYILQHTSTKNVKIIEILTFVLNTI